MKNVIMFLLFLLVALSAKGQEYTSVTSKNLDGKMWIRTTDNSGVLSRAFTFIPESYMDVEMKLVNGLMRPTHVGKVSFVFDEQDFSEFQTSLKKMTEFPLEAHVKMNAPLGVSFTKPSNSNSINLEYQYRYIVLSPGKVNIILGL